MIRVLVQEPLPRPERVQSGHWDAISDAYQRVGRAVEAEDFALVVGAAKELTESVARVTIAANGEVYADNASYSALLSAAHRIVAHAIRENLPPNDVLRAIPDNARKMATQLAEVRNRYGTGHGRADIHKVTVEVAEACVHAAPVWIRWVLARHTTVFLGNVTQLVSDLERANFHSGELAERLEAANILGLKEPEQRRLGVAVGRRTANETWTVRIDGVRACSTNPDRWPDAYRTGVIEGLFINRDNQVDAYPAASADCAAELLQHHTDPAAVLAELRPLLGSASWSFRFQGRHADVIQSMRDALPKMPADVRPMWNEIADTLSAHAPDPAS
ncbi:abortive infection family protein [Streptomyces sp. NPDC051211]|uniref:abortive infection family protein n=1 Tax=Streptomyces sp. NPDC051211 TaxID=3154643 RepID=UPI00344E1B8F